MKFIVTGATGHIGNNLVRFLLEKGENVTIVVRNPNDIAVKDLNCKKVIGDLSDTSFIESIIEAGSIIIHSAGVIDITEKRVEEMMKINVESTISLVQACIKNQAKKFIYLSSTDAIAGKNQVIKEPEEFKLDNLRSYYGITKAMASDYVLKAINQGLIDGCILCPSAVLGINDFKVSSQGSVVKNALKKKIVFYTKGNYNFVDVEKIVLAIYNASLNKCRPVYLLTGVEVTIKEFFKTIYLCLNKKPLMIYVPYFITIVGTSFSSIYYKLSKKKPVYTKMAISTLNEGKKFDSSLAEREIGLSKTDFLELISKTIEWFKTF